MSEDEFEDEFEDEECDPENCCAECKHGTIPCEGMTFEAYVEVTDLKPKGMTDE